MADIGEGPAGEAPLILGKNMTVYDLNGDAEDT